MNPTGRPGLSQRLSLVAVLAVVLLFELGLNRVAARLALHGYFVPTGFARVLVGPVGLFAFYFAGVLAVATATWALVTLTLPRSRLPRGARLPIAVVAVGFVPLVAAGVVQPLPPILGKYLVTTFTLLAVLVGLGGFLTRAPTRMKLGLLLVALPIPLRLTAAMMAERSDSASDALQWTAQLVLLVAAVAGVFLLRPRRFSPLAPLAGLAVAVAAMVVARVEQPIAVAVSVYGFGVELPPSLPAFAAGALALGAWVTLAAALLGEAGPSRLRGWGALVILLGGLEMGQPGTVAATLTGLACMLVSLEREGHAPSEDWRDFVGRVAAKIGCVAPVVTGSGDAGARDTARLRVTRDDTPVEVALDRRGGEMYHVEIVAGRPPLPDADPAPLSLTRRGTDRLGKTEGKVVETGDVFFDEAFRVRDARELHGPDPILVDHVRKRLVEIVEGWVGIWPGDGVRLRVRAARYLARIFDGNDEGLDELSQVLDVLVEIAGKG